MGTGYRLSTSKGYRLSITMTLHSNRPDARTDLLHGTLDMLILRTLQWGPQHGYAIGQTIRSMSSEVLQVEAGSLYPALQRLAKKGWVTSKWGQTDLNQRAKFYRLTPEGKKQFLREESRWTELVNAIGQVMNPAVAPAGRKE
jgi:PadR family transcriptional regulator PadR